MRVDLHIHSNASDGSWTPEELVAEVKKAEVGLFSVSDHDSVANQKAVRSIVPDSGLNFVTGVEITSKYNDKICHILGYGIDPDNDDLIEFCRINTDRLKAMNREQMIGIKKLIPSLDLNAFNEYMKNRNPSGLAIVDFLLLHKHFDSQKSALDFVIKSADWSGMDFPQPDETVSMITSCCGVPILAHPGSRLVDDGLTLEDIEIIVGLGVKGLECYTVYHNHEMTAHYLDFCRTRSLLITAGSDCHGPSLSSRVIGNPRANIEDLNLTGIWPM